MAVPRSLVGALRRALAIFGRLIAFVVAAAEEVDDDLDGQFEQTRNEFEQYLEGEFEEEGDRGDVKEQSMRHAAEPTTRYLCCKAPK